MTPICAVIHCPHHRDCPVCPPAPRAYLISSVSMPDAELLWQLTTPRYAPSPPRYDNLAGQGPFYAPGFFSQRCRMPPRARASCTGLDAPQASVAHPFTAASTHRLISPQHSRKPSPPPRPRFSIFPLARPRRRSRALTLAPPAHRSSHPRHSIPVPRQKSRTRTPCRYIHVARACCTWAGWAPAPSPSHLIASRRTAAGAILGAGRCRARSAGENGRPLGAPPTRSLASYLCMNAPGPAPTHRCVKSQSAHAHRRLSDLRISAPPPHPQRPRVRPGRAFRVCCRRRVCEWQRPRTLYCKDLYWRTGEARGRAHAHIYTYILNSQAPIVTRGRNAVRACESAR
ncbi:hypothetical protein DAEQUDRAFT_96875 [Daedalea quercina L-15889]|uniref:Uncharacterized protein n=1 Tax=Daedalea quercina L-15889 TaxID=1314783 RepID=A0A165SBY6_9APHY|nr:hypothetical protein DAEQUDRAFT_96875 [Daedalea quercina L-15889]